MSKNPWMRSTSSAWTKGNMVPFDEPFTAGNMVPLDKPFMGEKIC